MDPKTRKRIKTWAETLVGSPEVGKFYSIPFEDTGFGYDIYGGERECALAAYAVGIMLYKNYFRAQSAGLENIPSAGRIILAANRATLLPFDSFMVCVDMIHNGEKPRLLRVAANSTALKLPFVGLMFQRMGQAPDTLRNHELILKREEALLLYPEGRDGYKKLLAAKGHTKTFQAPFIELCLDMRAPIAPVALRMSERRTPALNPIEALVSKLRLFLLPKALNMLITGLIKALPPPNKLTIKYGAPISFFDEYPPETVQHPNLIRQMADVVKERVEEMLAQDNRE